MRDKTVAILESRLGRQLAELIEKHGGRALHAPALAEVADVDRDAIARLVADLEALPPAAAIFQTGVGTRALFDATDALGITARLLAVLEKTTVVVRGPKPTGGKAPRPVATVRISRERGFEPAQLTINRGDAVLWQNDDRSPQTVSGDPGLANDRSRVVLPTGAAPWTSPVLDNGNSYVHSFDVSGDYTYVSTTLERFGVVGRITVR